LRRNNESIFNSKFNGRIYCVIKNDVFPNTQEFRTQILTDIYIPRKEANYLLFLWLVQKENICNFILSFKQEEGIGSLCKYIERRDLDVNQEEEKFAIVWDQTQKNSQEYNKFDEYLPASGVGETNSERNEENSEKMA
jgi:hypothetical protein